MINELVQLRELTKTLIRKDEALETQAKGWKYAFDSVPDLVFISSIEGQIKFANKSLLERLCDGDVKSVYDFPCMRNLLKLLDSVSSPNMLLEENLNLGEIKIDILDGWFHHTMTPIKDKNDNVLGFICVLRDITDRKNAELEIKRSEERFRMVAHSAADAVIIIDSFGKVIYWNNAAERMFWYSSDEMAGKPIVNIIPDRYKQQHLEKFEKRLKSEGDYNYMGNIVHINGLRKDGTEFPVELVVTSWATEDGVFFSGIIRDLSQLKKTY
jgi:PAS domain S-box-containing protein